MTVVKPKPGLQSSSSTKGLLGLVVGGAKGHEGAGRGDLGTNFRTQTSIQPSLIWLGFGCSSLTAPNT